MGIYDRDYMKREGDDSSRRSSHSSGSSLADKLESISDTLFTKHRKVMIGIVVGILVLTLITFVILKFQ